jgi:hypothetical protein
MPRKGPRAAASAAVERAVKYPYDASRVSKVTVSPGSMVRRGARLLFHS